MRSLEHIAAILLLALLAVAAALLVWLWLAPRASSPGGAPEKCILWVDAVSEAVRTVSLRTGGSVTVGYGLYAWLRPIGCYARVERAYLLAGDGSLVAVLLPAAGPVKLEPGEASRVLLLPVDSPVVPPGSYRLVIPLRVADADDASVEVVLRWPLAAGKALFNKSLEELNGTVAAGHGFTVRVLVEPYTVTPEPDDYTVTVMVCAERGWWVYYARITVLNATLQPPIHVGPYYTAEESPEYLPYTYPDCTIRSFYPILASEQPLTIVAEAYTRRG